MAVAVDPDITVLELNAPDLRAIGMAQDLIDDRRTRAVVIQTEDADDVVALASLIAGASAIVPRRNLPDALRAAARGGSVRPRISIDGLVEAAGRVHPDDIPILGMLVHGTSPAEIAGVLGIPDHELAGRRKRMLKALLGELP